MSAHTPGPWTVTTLNGKHTVWGLDSVVCQTQTALPNIDNRLGAPTCPETAAANARLISAAPELLEALKAMVETPSMTITQQIKAFGMARKAIARAEETK